MGFKQFLLEGYDDGTEQPFQIESIIQYNDQIFKVLYFVSGDIYIIHNFRE